MNTIDLVADDLTAADDSIEYDLSACESQLKNIFSDFTVDDVSQIELKVQALEEELKNTKTESRKRAFEKIIDDRKSYLPAFSFSFGERKDVVGLVSYRRIRLFCRNGVDLPNEICRSFLMDFIQTMKGELYIDGELFDSKKMPDLFGAPLN